MGRPANPDLPQALRRAAVEEFSERGLAAAKVSAITARAGASKGAFYLHFISKEALYVDLARAFLGRLVDQLGRYACDPGVPPTDPAAFIAATEGCDRELFDFLWQERESLAMVVDGAIGSDCAFLLDEFIDTIQRTMAMSIATHPVVPGRPNGLSTEFLAAMATGMLYMYARRVVREKTRPDVREGVAHFRKILTLGVLVPPGMIDAVLAEPALLSCILDARPAGSAACASPAAAVGTANAAVQ